MKYTIEIKFLKNFQRNIILKLNISNFLHKIFDMMYKCIKIKRYFLNRNDNENLKTTNNIKILQKFILIQITLQNKKFQKRNLEIFLVFYTSIDGRNLVRELKFK